MNISIYILVNKLKESFSFSYNGILSSKLNLEKLLFYSDGDKILENKIYICNSTTFHNIPISTIIISIGPSVVDSSSSCNNIIELDKDISPFKVFNFIQDVFDIYDKWDNSLQQILNRDGTIDEMIDCSFEIFNNPIVIHTSDFQLISYSKVMDNISDFDDLLNDELFFDTVNLFKMDSMYNTSLTSLKPFLFPNHLTGKRSLCINLFKHNIYTHRIVVIENTNSVCKDDSPLLQHFSKYIDLALSKILITDTRYSDTLDNTIYKIITEEISDTWNIEHTLSEFSWLPDHSYICITIKVSDLDINTKTIKSLCSKIKILVGDCATFLYKEQIVVFINLSKSQKHIDDIKQNIVCFLRDCYLKAGISEQFSGLSQISNYYIQSSIALNYGIKRDSHVWLHYFSNIATYYLFECCTKDLPPNLVCSGKLLKLKEYDEENNTEFYLTLNVYLQNFLNAVQSSKQLFIHRSTFLYRIKKIKELTGVDFNDLDEILYLLMSYKLLDKYFNQNVLNVTVKC